MDLHAPGTSSDHGCSPVSSDLNLPSVEAEVQPEESVLGEIPPQLGAHHRTGGRGPQPAHQCRAAAHHRWPTGAAPGRLQYEGHCSSGRCSDRKREPRKGNHHLSKPGQGSLSLGRFVCLASLFGCSRTATEKCTIRLKHSCCLHNLSAQGSCDERVERVWWRLA